MSIIKIHQLLGLNPFDAERHLKHKLSTSFWSDSNDFLWRVQGLLNGRPHDTRGYFAKIYVDLIMSAECALKSLIISLSDSNETPEDVYSKARSFSHNLENLYKEVESRAKGKVKLLTKNDRKILLKANTLGVGYRYDITTFFFFIQENNIDRAFEQGKVSSIINYRFINQLYKMLHTLNNIAYQSFQKHYGKDIGVSGTNLTTLKQREKTFFNSVKNKL